MKKLISITLFILIIALFIFDLCFSIIGAFDVKNQLAELASRGASGHELWGVGIDILTFAVIIISIVGGAASLFSRKVAQYRLIRTVSSVLCPMFFLPGCIAAIIVSLG